MKPELRWAKKGRPIHAVPIGTPVRAEIVDAMSEPTGFRVWRSAGVLAWLFTRFRRPKPLFLRVGGSDRGLIYSEEMDTGSALTWKADRFEFDPNAIAPRSPPLNVVPRMLVERRGGGSAVASAELAAGSDLMPAKAGTSFRLGATRSTRWLYDLTAVVDPEFEARVLVPWAGGDDELRDYFVDLLDAEAAEASSRPPGSFREEATTFLRNLASDDEAVAARFEPRPTHFSMAEGERKPLVVAVHAERPGSGVFAIQLVDRDGITSTSEPWLYVVSDGCEEITLYDVVVRDVDVQAEERIEVADLTVEPITVDEELDLWSAFALPEEEAETGTDEELTAGA